MVGVCSFMVCYDEHIHPFFSFFFFFYQSVTFTWIKWILAGFKSHVLECLNCILDIMGKNSIFCLEDDELGSSSCKWEGQACMKASVCLWVNCIFEVSSVYLPNVFLLCCFLCWSFLLKCLIYLFLFNFELYLTWMSDSSTTFIKVKYSAFIWSSWNKLKNDQFNKLCATTKWFKIPKGPGCQMFIFVFIIIVIPQNPFFLFNCNHHSSLMSPLGGTEVQALTSKTDSIMI